MGRDKTNPFRRPPIRKGKIKEEPERVVVTRGTWGALDSGQGMPATALPVENVIITYGTGTPPCLDPDSCQRTLRELQQAHMARGLPDIAYNFLIGGDFKIYEGRGWDLKPEKNETFPDIYDDSIEIAFIGDYREITLTDMGQLMVEAYHLIDKGVHAKNVLRFFRMRETTPKLKLESLIFDDSIPWRKVKRKSELNLDLTRDDPDKPEEDDDMIIYEE